MKKNRTHIRILSLLLCLSMILGMAPMIRLFTPAQAAEGAAGIAAAGSCGSCSDHTEWTALTQEKLDSYAQTNQNTSFYDLPTGNYYLSEDVTLKHILWISGVTVHLDLNGHKIQADAAATYKAINPKYHATTALVGFVAATGGATKVTLCDTVGGGVIDGAKMTVTNMNGLVAAHNGASVDMYGGTVTGANTTGNGGGVYITYMGKFNFHGGAISGNTAANGGGVYVGTNTSTFVMNGGVISNNTATNGGAFYAAKNTLATLTINGGKITGNTGNGSVILSNATNITIHGGEFSGNIGNNTFLISGTTFVMDGGKVDGNYTTAAKTAKPTLKLNNYQGASTGAFSGSAVVGDAGVEISTVIGANNPAAASAKVENLAEGASILFKAGSVPSVKAEDTTVTDDGNNKYFFNIPWQGISGNVTAGSIAANSYYKLTGDVTLDSTVAVSGAVTVDLAGYALTGAAAPFFNIAGGAKLTVMDSSAEKTGKIVGLAEAKASNAPMILVNVASGVGGTFVLNGGTLTGHYRTKVNASTDTNGAAVLVQNYGTFVMNGGAIKDNHMVGSVNGYGAAVSIATNGSFTMNDGEISGNTANYGAGVAYTNGTVTINGGKISGNTAKNGGVFSLAAAGKVTVNGGEISGNTGTTGSVFHSNKNVGIVITGGIITGNIGNHVVNVSGTKVTMSGGKIDGNVKTAGGDAATAIWLNNYLNSSSAEFSGSAVVGDAGVGRSTTNRNPAVAFAEGTIGNLAEGASILCAFDLTIQDESVSRSGNLYTYQNPQPQNISGNVDALGSGEYTLAGDVNLTAPITVTGSTVIDLAGYTITGVSAPYFKVNAGATLTVKDSSAAKSGKIQGISAATYMIGVNGTFNLEGGTLTGQKSTAVGGAIYSAATATVNISGGKISGNTATRGGAVYNNGGKLNISGGELSGNTATYGGAIFGACSKDASVLSRIVITGGVISGNSAGDQGGAMYVSGDLTIEGGEITGNTAPNYGAICGAATDLIVTGGYIHDNTSTKSAADVQLITTSAGGAPASTASTCDISGAPVITDTMNSQTEIAIHDLGYGAEVWCGKTAELTEGDTSVASEVDPSAGVTVYTSTLQKTWCDDHDKTHTGWTALTQSALAGYAVSDTAGSYYKLTAGNYYLTQNIVLDKTLVISGLVHLDLNGFTVESAADASYAYLVGTETCVTMIMINGGSNKLQLCDVTGLGKIDASAYTKTNLKGIVRANNGGVFNMYGGILTGNKLTTQHGSAVWMTYKAAFNMYGGTITGNKTTAYGTVFVNTNTSSFTMYGGTISGNEAGRGGAVATASAYTAGANAKVTIHGGTIENNTATYGGAFYAPGNSTGVAADVTINGGVIRGNTAKTDGSVIYGKHLTVNGGVIEENTDATNTNNSGAIWLGGYAGNTADPGHFVMTGGTIQNNTDKYAVFAAVPVTISGNAKIDALSFSGTGAISNLAEGAYINSAKALAVQSGDPTVAVEGSYVYTYKKPISNGVYITVPTGTGYEYIPGKDLVQVADHNNAANVSTQLGLAVAEATTDKTILDNATIVWKSSDETVAQVSAAGVVTYGKWGKAVITATVEGTEYYASINIQVGEEPVKVLIIGNSFSRDSLYYLSTLGLYTDNRVTAGYLYQGSATLRDHAKNLMTGGTYTYCKTDAATGSMQRSAEGMQYTIPQALADEDWDYVVLQHGVLTGGFTTTYNSDLEYLVDYIEANVDADTKLYWNMTWAVKDGMSLSNKGRTFKEVYNSSQEVMYNALIEAMDQFIVGNDAPYSSANADNLGTGTGWGFDGYFFTGAAIQQLRGVAGVEPTRDGYHLGHVNGRVAAALSILKVLFPALDLDSVDEIDGLIAAINACKEDENYGKYPAEADLDAAALTKIITAVKAASADAADSDGLPTKLSHNDETKANTAEGVITVGKVNAPLKLHFPDLAFSKGEIFASAYQNIVHVTGKNTDTHIMQEGGGTIIVWKGKQAYTNAQWQASFENDQLLHIDEAWLEAKGLVPNDGVLYNRYEALLQGKTVYAMADARDPNLVAGKIDVTGDGVKEDVVLLTFWVNYHNNAGAIVDRTCYLMHTADGGATWTDPQPLYVGGNNRGVNPVKRGDIAIYEDGNILIPLYSTLCCVEMKFDVSRNQWVEVENHNISNHASYETTTLNEISFVATKLNGQEVTYRMDRESGVVMISYNRGETWTEVGNEPGLIHQPGFTVVDEDTIYASWARTSSPRTVYGTVYEIYGNWADTPTVEVYASGNKSSHDMGDPSCAALSSTEVAVIAYDTEYRSIVMTIEDLTGEEYRPSILEEEGDQVIYTDKVSELPMEAPEGSYIIEATLSAAGTVKTPVGSVAVDAGSVKLAVVGNIVYRKTGTTWAVVATTAGSSDGKIYIDNATACKIYDYVQVTLQETLEAISGDPDIQLLYTYTPEHHTVTFSSSDENVVKVDAETGLVKIVDEGTATVTMTVSGQVKRTCAVTIGPKPMELTGRGETVIIMQDDYEEDKYTAGENALWKHYWANKDTSFYLFENANGMTEASNGNLKYNIVDNGDGNQYLEMTGAGNTWMATAAAITGNYTTRFDILFTGDKQINLTPWQNDLRVETQEVHGFVNLWAHQYRFQFRGKNLREDSSTTTNPNMYCVGNNQQSTAASVAPSGGAQNVWQSVKITRVDGGLYLKIWPKGTTEPADWTCVLTHEVLDTNMDSHFRFQFQSSDTQSCYIDNLVVSQQVAEMADVTFQNGNETVDTQKVEPGSKVTEPTAPVKEGYTFAGWYNGDIKWNFDNAVTEDMTLTAKFEVNKYTVTVGEAEQTVEHGGKVTKPADPTKEGYMFVGWYNGDKAWNFETDTVTGALTLTAKFEINKYTVTINGVEQTVEHGAKLEKPADPTKEGYTFAGWYNGDEKWDFEADTVTGAVELVAKFEINKYTVTMNGVEQTVEHGAKLTKPADPVKEGYTFVGWYNGDEKWDFEADTVTGVLELTAKWEVIQSGGDTGDSGSGSGSGSDEPSKTEDRAMPMAFALLVMLSVCGLAVVVTGKKKLF